VKVVNFMKLEYLGALGGWGVSKGSGFSSLWKLKLMKLPADLFSFPQRWLNGLLPGHQCRHELNS